MTPVDPPAWPQPTRTSIIRLEGQQASWLTIEPELKLAFGQLGLTAVALFAQQDVKLWSKAADRNFLPKMKRGAKQLVRISATHANTVVLRDRAAHPAFIACVFLASQTHFWTNEQRNSLRTALLVLAECCEIYLPIPTVPRRQELALPFRLQSLIHKHYPSIEKAAGGSHRLTIADALRLLEMFERLPSVPLIPLMNVLREATEGLRTALKKIQAA